MNRRERRMTKRRGSRRARDETADIMAPVFQVPEDPMSALSRAGQLHQAGRFNQAEALYMETSERWPDNADAPHWLGVLALQRGDPDKAVGLIGRAIAIQDGNPQFYYHLGEAERAAGNRAAAAVAYRRAIGLAPRVADPHFGLGLALLDDDPDAAIEHFSQVLKIDPNFAPAREALAAAQANRQGSAQ